MKSGMRGGQAMLEYILVFAGLLAVAAILCVLVGATFRHAERARNLVAADYP